MAAKLPSQLTLTTSIAGDDLVVTQLDGETTVKSITKDNFEQSLVVPPQLYDTFPTLSSIAAIDFLSFQVNGSNNLSSITFEDFENSLNILAPLYSTLNPNNVITDADTLTFQQDGGVENLKIPVAEFKSTIGLRLATETRTFVGPMDFDVDVSYGEFIQTSSFDVSLGVAVPVVGTTQTIIITTNGDPITFTPEFLTPGGTPLGTIAASTVDNVILVTFVYYGTDAIVVIFGVPLLSIGAMIEDNYAGTPTNIVFGAPNTYEGWVSASPNLLALPSFVSFTEDATADKLVVGHLGAGTYGISFSSFSSSSTRENILMEVRVNNVLIPGARAASSTGSQTDASMSGSAHVHLDVADEVQVFFFKPTTGTVELNLCQLTLTRLVED